MKTVGSSPPLSPRQRHLVGTLFREDPGASLPVLAGRAARLLARRVTADQVKHCRPADLAVRRGRTRLTEHDASVPAARARQGLAYRTPLEALILESRTVRRRLGLGRKGVAA